MLFAKHQVGQHTIKSTWQQIFKASKEYFISVLSIATLPGVQWLVLDTTSQAHWPGLCTSNTVGIAQGYSDLYPGYTTCSGNLTCKLESHGLHR